MFRKLRNALKSLWEKMVEADRLIWKDRIAHGFPHSDETSFLYGC